ncbi:uncharacterized protein C8Q71DRAFT_217495 [Rhodofomes roseus]|uniref:N-acetyltransferase ECO1 n=1 Tax=Rhodofomes roseus TaxID=34475 RepID=A0A4Y9XZF3_9APHY|nr:uncharacterized protein C8Q71DRAFT_217495 [Rhodofomes roseus]KAH9842720.1 hypothetical protein C8Q71DRAFT_217495 [Rhodofomes roseus]TFY54717.1 hypothetical protein EVJ58_g8695 [Rhodofomes roseus]
MAPDMKRTYTTRASRLPLLPSTPPSDLASSSPPPVKRKRSFLEETTVQNSPTPSSKRPRKSISLLPKGKDAQKGKKGVSDASKKQQKLTQLHFALDVTVLKTCEHCDLSYTKGAPDDESLHRKHCARVQRGLEWGREEEREALKANVEELAAGVKLKNGTKGRMVFFRPDVGGKIGTKLATLLETMSLALSSPPLSAAVLKQCKIYLFLLPTSSSTSLTPREKIVGCVIAQRISTAMAIATDADVAARTSTPAPGSKAPVRRPLHSLIPVDTSSNLYVHPAPLPTPMGIPRLFVSSAHRRLGIATHLLTAAAKNFILGCPLDPTKGEIAFTQPTGAGKSVLEAWGKGGIRIYEEEQGR